MSDTTTTTITPKERAKLRELAQRAPGPWNNKSVCYMQGFWVIVKNKAAYAEYACNSVPRLLTALEAAEAESATLRKRLEVLAEALAWGAAKDKKSIFDKLPFIDSKKKWIEYAEKEAARRAVAESEVGE